MDCYTDTPCVQVYSGNFLGEEPTFKYGVKPTRQHAICLETQYEPDAVNHGEGILRVGNTFHHTTVYKFSHR
jgi:aldose 1-epimerase